MTTSRGAQGPGRWPASAGDVAQAVIAGRDEWRAWLEELVRIPSVSAQPEHALDLVRSAEMTATILRSAGLEHVELLEVDNAPAYVTGEWVHHGDAPTVLLYAHHDVQPTPSAHNWASPPFEPTEHQGRLYGRGTADDKAGIVMHAAAIAAWLQTRGTLPVNVKVLIEGEEEIGSPHLPAFLDQHSAGLRSDVIVLADLVNWKVGWPGLTRSLRGMGDVYVTVRTLRQPVHSGMWGGPIPDAATAMIQLLATLHDRQGRIAVDGFCDDVMPLSEHDRTALAELDEDASEIRSDVRMLDGVQFIGQDNTSLLERMWWQPTITPTGMDVPPLAQASNTLLSSVTAKLSCRFAPGQDPDRAIDALTAHLQHHVPWGAHIDVERGARNAAWSTSTEGPAYDAAVAAMSAGFGRPPAILGCGGSIPFVHPMSTAFDDAPCLLVGVEDPHSNAHGEDESLHLEDFERACLSEAFLLSELADRWPSRGD